MRFCVLSGCIASILGGLTIWVTIFLARERLATTSSTHQRAPCVDTMLTFENARERLEMEPLRDINTSSSEQHGTQPADSTTNTA